MSHYEEQSAGISAHSNVNDPTVIEKEALKGSLGTPSVANKFVTQTGLAVHTDAAAPHTAHAPLPMGQASLAVEVIASSVGIGIPFVVIFRPTAAGTLAYTVPAGKKLKLISVLPCIKAAAAGDAAATAQLLNVANPITDAKSLNGIADQALWNFTTIDDAFLEVAAAAALNCTSAETGASGCDAVIPVVCMWITP